MNLGDLNVDWFPMPPLLLEIGFVLLAVTLWRYGRVLGTIASVAMCAGVHALNSVAVNVRASDATKGCTSAPNSPGEPSRRC